MNQKILGYLETITAVSIWAISSGIIVRYINQSAEIIYGAGAAAGFIFVFLWLLLKGDQNKIKESFPWKNNLALIGLFIGLNNGLFYAAIKLTTISNAILTHYFEPILLVLIFAPIILKQKILKGHIIASFLGFMGLLIILWPQINTKEINIGIFLGLVSAIFFAWHTAIESKLATTTKIDPLIEVLYKNGVPALMFLPFVIKKGASGGIPMEDWGKLVFFGILVLGISFILLYRGLSKISSQNASVLFYGEPIGAIALAAIFLRESLSLNGIIGGVLILVAGYLVIKESKT